MGDSLSAHDSKFVSIAFKCMKSKPDIDYAKFAQMAGLKGVKSARDGFAAVYKRLELASDETEGSNSEAGEPSPEKAKATRKRKAPAAPKKAAVGRGKKVKVEEEPVHESSDEADDGVDAVDSAADDAAAAEDVKSETNDE